MQDLCGISFVELVSCHHLELSKWYSYFKKGDWKVSPFCLIYVFFPFYPQLLVWTFYCNTNLPLQLHNWKEEEGGGGGRKPCLKGRFTHAIFDAIFVLPLNTTFVPSVNLRRFHCEFAAIRVRYLLPPSPKSSLILSCNKFWTCSKPMRYRSDKNRIGVATSSHFRFLSRVRVGQKLIWKVGKIAQKNRLCKPSVSRKCRINCFHFEIYLTSSFVQFGPSWNTKE